MLAPLDIDGRISAIADDGAEITLRADNSIIRIELPNLWAIKRYFYDLIPSHLRRQVLVHLRAGAIAADLEVRFTVADQLVAELDTRSQGSLLARLFGLGTIKLHPLSIVLSIFRRNR